MSLLPSTEAPLYSPQKPIAHKLPQSKFPHISEKLLFEGRLVKDPSELPTINHQMASINAQADAIFKNAPPGIGVSRFLYPTHEGEEDPVEDSGQSYPLIGQLFINPQKPTKTRLFLLSGTDIYNGPCNSKMHGPALLIKKNYAKGVTQKEPELAFYLATKLDSSKPNYDLAHQRAIREIDCLKELHKKPGICTLLNYGTTTWETHYLGEVTDVRKMVFCFEKKYATDLFDYIIKFPTLIEPNSLEKRFEQVRPIVEQILASLRSLEEKAIIHHDIKPENYLVDDDGTIGLCDFEAAYLHTSILLRNTAKYLSPEYWTRHNKEDKENEKTDIWAAGIVIYLLVFGEFPFWNFHIEPCYFFRVGLKHFHATLEQVNALASDEEYFDDDADTDASDSIRTHEAPGSSSSSLPEGTLDIKENSEIKKPQEILTANDLRIFAKAKELIESIPVNALTKYNHHLDPAQTDQFFKNFKEFRNAIRSALKLLTSNEEKMIRMLKFDCDFKRVYAYEVAYWNALEREANVLNNCLFSLLKEIENQLTIAPRESNPILKLIQEMLTPNPDERHIPELQETLQ